MTHDDAPAVGRDELREKLRHLTRDPGTLGSAVCALLKAAEAELPVMVMPDESRAILDLLVPQETRADDPETDGTDFAHPAYFRGKRDGIRGAVDALERVLDHGRRGGTFGDERLQAFAARLDSLRAVAQDAPPPPTTPDVPAERERDELRERLVTTLAAPLGVQVNRAIAEAEAALLAPQEAPAEGISLSAQLSQAAAWMRVWDECQRLGMDTYGAPSTSTGLDIVLDFIRGRAAQQEAREPEVLGYVVGMDNLPARIWLQRDTHGEVTWCAERINDDDVEYVRAPAEATTCPCGGGPGHGDAWCGDYECPTCGRGPKLDEAIFQAGLERGRADMAPAEATERSES